MTATVPAAVRLAVAGWVATLLAATTVLPLVDGTTWLFDVALLGALTGGAGLVAHRFTSSPVVVVAAQLAVWVLAVTVMFLGSTAVLGVLPGPDSVGATRDLLAQGLRVMHQAAPPVPARPGAIFVTATGLALVGRCWSTSWW